MPKKVFSQDSTKEQVALKIGAVPGTLGGKPLSAQERTALKYFVRRWCGASAELTRGPIEAVRELYDTRGKTAWQCAWSGSGKEVFFQGNSPQTAHKEPENSEYTPETEPEQAPQAHSEPNTEPTAAPKPQGEENPNELIAALRKAVGGAIDADKVRQIAAEEINKAVSKLPTPEPEKIIINAATGEQKKAEGHQHKIFKRIVRLVDARKNIFIQGPTGCGKTHLVQQVAKHLEMNFASISCSEGLSESKILGWLLPIGDSGKFEYVESDFIRIYEGGGVFLFDEMDSSDANTLTIFNQGLANGGFYLPQRLQNSHVKKHKDFVCVAAANTLGHGADSMYVGRNQLDLATLDRFRAGFSIMDYDEKLESDLGHVDVIDFAARVRKAIKDHKLRRVFSTRAIIDNSDLVKNYGFTMEEIREAFFADWTQAEIDKVGAN